MVDAGGVRGRLEQQTLRSFSRREDQSIVAPFADIRGRFQHQTRFGFGFVVTRQTTGAENRQNLFLEIDSAVVRNNGNGDRHQAACR